MNKLVFPDNVRCPLRYIATRWIQIPLACCLTLAAGCSKEPTPPEPVVPVQIVTVEKKSMQRLVTAQGVLFPIEQSALTPKIGAPVKAFFVRRGSKVHQGELLATLENRDLSGAATDTKGAYDQAQAVYETTTGADLPEQIRKAEGDAVAAKQLLEAQEKVYKSRQDLFQQGALPRKDLDQAGVDLTQARNQSDIAQHHLEALQKIGKQATLKSAAGQLESAKGKYQVAQADLSYSEIRSPINGVVTERPLFPGEMAQAGAPLLTIMDVSRVVCRAHIPQSEAALLKVGDKASLQVPGEQDSVAGTVTVVSPALDPNSTTVEIWVEAKNPGQRLKPGSSARVSIVAQTAADALAIPVTALLTGPDGATAVMLAGSDGRAHQQAVKTGIHEGDDVQITEGVKEGEKVVGSGAYGLPDNTKIQAQEIAADDPNGKDKGDAVTKSDEAGAKSDDGK